MSSSRNIAGEDAVQLIAIGEKTLETRVLDAVSRWYSYTVPSSQTPSRR